MRNLKKRISSKGWAQGFGLEPIGYWRITQDAPAVRVGRRVPMGTDWERLLEEPSPRVEQLTQNQYGHV
ncbi:hypothetical protein BVC80_8967g4 [Macleaya cordata]|uniref:Uncharacterized protein n=1 Tax=Macleaya cordata TaxID=56857 RepID=A0A200PLX0_MACCD|nr:hypothetical protein BVC80_8967g4 [Macleaya cordata]